MYKVSLTFVLILFCGKCFSQDCTPPDSIMTLEQRADNADIMAYVKVLEIVNRQTTSYGQTYSAYVELICTLKNTNAAFLHEFFTINDLGERPDGCPSREVNHQEDYVFFLTRTTDVVYTVNEVNKQSGVVPASWDNMQALTTYVKPCLTGVCRPNDDPNWKPMNEAQRADLAEIVVWAKVVKKHEWGSANGQYIVQAQTMCEMKVPGNMNGGLGSSFNVTNVGALEGVCDDRHVSVDHEFIMLLTRHFAYFPLPGQTPPPEILDNYVLGLDEVNSQHALFNVTDDVLEGFKDYLVGCENSSSAVSFQLTILLSAIFISLTLLF